MVLFVLLNLLILYIIIKIKSYFFLLLQYNVNLFSNYV